MNVRKEKLSPARVKLQDAIAARDKAEADVTNASKAVELQAADLAKANAALEKYADLDSRAASVKATKIKSMARGGKLLPVDYEAGIRSERHAKRLSEEAADDERIAYDQLRAEAIEAEHDLAEATGKLAAAIEAVIGEDAAALLEKAKAADAHAAALRGQLLSLDFWAGLPGHAPRPLLEKSALLKDGWLRGDTLTALATQAPNSRETWRALYNALATNAASTWDDYKSLSAETPPPSVQPLVPALRYEETPAYAHERGRVARDAPAESAGMMAKPTNSPLG